MAAVLARVLISRKCSNAYASHSAEVETISLPNAKASRTYKSFEIASVSFPLEKKLFDAIARSVPLN